MPAAAGIAILGLAGGLGLAVATSRKKHVAKAGEAQYELDADLPIAQEQAVLHALSTEHDPRALETLARQYDAQGYHLTAEALRRRAHELLEEPPPTTPGGGGEVAPAIPPAGAPPA